MDQPAREMCGIRLLLAPAGGHEGPLPELLLPSQVGSTQVVTSRHVSLASDMPSKCRLCPEAGFPPQGGLPAAQLDSIRMCVSQAGRKPI